MISWTIRTAKESRAFVDILVSTDHTEIASIGASEGALVPWLRPDVLSTDMASSVDVALHALDWYESSKGPVDGLALLQPTSPFRSVTTVRDAVTAFASDASAPLASVSAPATPPGWCVILEDGLLSPVLGWDQFEARSQDLQPTFYVNGVVFIVPPKVLREQAAFVTRSTVPFLMADPAEAHDIDTEWDWMIAETIFRARLGGG